ncbi:MAG: DUF3526 domain-containing protein [Bacteroidota bacterium]
MRKEVIWLIASQFWRSAFKSKGIYLLMGIMAVLLSYAAYSGIQYHEQNHFREDHQEIARDSWEANPDKHPHRMAHFGTFAFRIKHPLSIFDFGIESFTGNAVFLEAHKQNMVNFSEASFSTGLLRFGELSLAMILSTLLPLVVFFIGYSAVAGERENGTLKIFLTQGAKWLEILVGKSLGLLGISLLFILPFLLTTLILLISESHLNGDTWLRFGLVSTAYLLFTCILCFISIFVSARSLSSKDALVKLLGLWLLMVVLLPRTTQALGAYFYQTPSKLTFRSVIEEEVIQTGDSHNPNDPHYTALRDSVLRVHKVESVTELPFNYGGFVMSQGEKLSTHIYNKHYNDLLDQYRRQNLLMRWLALVNPYLAIKNLSMALCGTDFETYVGFQKQAEDYRYMLAQKMNDLQMKYISAQKVSGSEGKTHVVDRAEWEAFPDFSYAPISIGSSVRYEFISIFSLLMWTVLMIFWIGNLSKKAKAI